MLRFIAVCISVISYLIFSIPEFIFLWLVGKFSEETRDAWALASVQKGFKFILWIAGVDVLIKGEENIPPGPVLFVANHRSQFDILLTYSRVNRVTGYVAKKEMERIPLLNTRMKSLHCLFLDRENPREGLKTILAAVEKIKSGLSICIFPEGTRNKGEEGSLLEFKEGSFKIADKTGCPIVPIAITNAEAIFERQFPRIVKSKVIMEYCKPIYVEDMEKADRRKLGVISSDIISRTLNEHMKSL